MASSRSLFDAYGPCPLALPASVTRHRTEPDPVAKIFGDAVRRERKDQGLTLEQLGARFGRPDGKYLGEVERGFHAPTITMAKQIADALDLPLATLVSDLDN